MSDLSYEIYAFEMSFFQTTLQFFFLFEFVTMFLETLWNKKALYVNHTILFLPGKGTEN